MFNVLSSVNWLAFVIAAAASIGLAGLWFPVLIAKPYLVALGRQDAPPAQGGPVSNLGPLVCTIVVTLTSAVLIEALNVTRIADAVVFGLVVGIGYLAAMTFQIAINPNFPRPLYYGLLNAPYFVIAAVLSSVIMTAMR